MRPDHLHIISRSVAKSIGLKRYFTGKPCKRGHVSERLLSNNQCIDCMLEKRIAARLSDPEKAREEWRRSHHKNKEKRNAYSRDYRTAKSDAYEAAQKAYKEKNGEKIRQKAAAYREANRAYLNQEAARYRKENKEACIERTKVWRETNKPAYLASKAERRAAEFLATPKWADRKAIEDVYRRASELTRETGILHHVDHVIPLRGKMVCGLHVHLNLEAIPAAENMAKSNRFAIES